MEKKRIGVFCSNLSDAWLNFGDLSGKYDLHYVVTEDARDYAKQRTILLKSGVPADAIHKLPNGEMPDFFAAFAKLNEGVAVKQLALVRYGQRFAITSCEHTLEVHGTTLDFPLILRKDLEAKLSALETE